MAVGSALVPVEAGEYRAPASGYTGTKGEQFFLLTDSAFGSQDEASVRLETQTGYQLDNYGGVDVVLYQVPQPMEFLKKQKNLHRIDLKGAYQDEGLANTLGFLWDKWYKTSRVAWQRIFSAKARSEVVKTAPVLSQTDPNSYSPRFSAPPQYKPLPGFSLVSRFRYPVHKAKPIAPPKDVKLEGSSSEFLTPQAGNVRVPLGKLKPGLYLVEAYLGSFRANTLLFVSDTVAVSKISGNELLVWTANKKSGQRVSNAQLAWTDGAGTLQSGSTDSQGLLTFKKASPEQSYLLGQDPAGGVFVSENFYYDSEIYSTKLFIHTDRPLYRPGDMVNLKLMGREFTDALHSKPLAAGKISIGIFDANGTQVATLPSNFDPAAGGEAQFRLPENAGAGGYQIRALYQGGVYAAAFRVAQYVKPHYEIHILPAKTNFKTGEKVKGRIQLAYPDGKPVASASVSLSVKAQKLSMVEGELNYLGQLPVQIEKTELSTDKNGIAEFELPEVTDPSRYIVSVLSADEAAYRVSTTKEILIQAGAARYGITAATHFTQPGESVSFQWQNLSGPPQNPARWEAVRLEDRSSQSGAISGNAFKVSFAQPGSYSLRLLDGNGNLMGAGSHWVSGNGLTSTPGSIDIVFDKDRYQAGDTAHALINFDQPVDDALVTLERDRVEAVGLLSQGGNWLKLRKLTASQWQADIPVKDNYGPNMTFSVLYVKNGDYVFQNRGLVVALPRVELKINADRAVYQPGDTVNVDIAASLNGQPLPNTRLAVSVVDEMIYMLQPEIAPDIFDFFFHARRNNVRTGLSLNFHGYDMATSPKAGPPASANRYDRPFKVMERPRREEIDTAAWQPRLLTDASGHVRFSFRVPDSLTRWRLTARAMSPDGVVGQNIAFVRSEKPLYAKWVGPTRFRDGDAPQIAMAIFNGGAADRELEVSVNGLDAPFAQKFSAKPGANYLNLPVTVKGVRDITIHLKDQGREVDSLATHLTALPPGWASTRVVKLTLDRPELGVKLPADARNIRLSLGEGGMDAVGRVVEDLIDYPYGCVEQTSSRLIPLALAMNRLPLTDSSLPVINQLEQRLQTSRLRLVQMAGPDAVFAWWGQSSKPSAFLTTYAYFADWLASRRLGLQLPPEHWQYVQKVYQEQGAKEPLFNRVLIVWMMQQMQLPTRTLLEGINRDLATAARPQGKSNAGSQVLSDGETLERRAMAVVLAGVIARNNALPQPEALAAEATQALPMLAAREEALPRALALLAAPDAGRDTVAADILDTVASDYATIDRALALVWVDRALSTSLPASRPANLALGAPWQASKTLLGSTLWRYTAPVNGALSIKLGAAPSRPVTALLSYDSNQPEASRLPVSIERRLYALSPAGEQLKFDAERLKDWKVSNAGLYVDEIVLVPAAGRRMSYGLLEVPLPPGADVESTTWGLSIVGLDNSKEALALEEARHQPGELNYAVPVPELNGRVVIRHLVRFSQRGRFSLPPARFWRMYQPTEKSFENKARVVAVE